MNSALLMGSGAVAGLIAGFWSTVKAQLFKIFSLFFVTLKIEGVDINRAVYVWLWSECICFNIGAKHYSSDYEYVQPLEKTQLVGLKITPQENTLWLFNRKPFWVHRGGDSCMTITFIRGVFNPDNFVINIVENHNNLWCSKSSTRGNHFYIRRMVGSIGKRERYNNGAELTPQPNTIGSPAKPLLQDKETSMPLKWKRKQLGFPVNCGSLDLLSLQENVLSAYREILTWKNSERWFKSRKIPWKRGLLLTGVPGCVLADTKIKVRKIKEGKHAIHTYL